MNRTAMMSAAVLTFAAGCSGACSSEEPPAGPMPSDAGGDTGNGGTSGSTGGVGGSVVDASDASPCVPPPKPDIVPEGWDAYTDFSCKQPFYVPSSEKYFPEPITWEACPAPSKLSSGCRWMKVTWPGTTSSLRNKLSSTSEGHPILSFSRLIEEPGDGHMLAVAVEADGPVRFAMMGPRLATAGYALVQEDLNEDELLLQALGADGKTMNAFDSPRKAALKAKLGKLHPEVLQLEVTPSVYSWRVSSKLAVRGEAPALRLTAFPLDGASAFELASPATDPDGLVPDMPTLLGDTAVFGIGSLMMQGIMAYDPVKKTHALVRWYGDTNKGAYNAGTDGKDLVWTLGEDRLPEGGYSKRSVWTSPFSTDPSKLAPKRLRSDPQTAYDVNFVVACGYAAHKLQLPDGMLVVRLSDGASWILQNNLDNPDKTGWHWYRAIGLTCEELFVTAAVVSAPGAKLVYTVARVRLDSLGPALPPD